MARSLFLIPLLVAVASAAQLTIKSTRFSITSSDGSQLRSESLPVGHGVPSMLTLGPSDSLRLTFNIVEKTNETAGVQPHQTFLRFYDEKTGEEGIQPVQVTHGGKAKFDLNMARPPTSLPPSGVDPLKVSLILGSFVHEPLHMHLFDLALPTSAPPPQHPDEPTFHVQPEIVHTFRPEPKSPPKIVSAIFTGTVLSPWVVLLALLSHVPHKMQNLAHMQILLFIVLLTAMEGLLLWYWVALRLGQVLVYGAVLGFVIAFIGNRALNAIAHRRVQSVSK